MIRLWVWDLEIATCGFNVYFLKLLSPISTSTPAQKSRLSLSPNLNQAQFKQHLLRSLRQSAPKPISYTFHRFFTRKWYFSTKIIYPKIKLVATFRLLKNWMFGIQFISLFYSFYPYQHMSEFIKAKYEFLLRLIPSYL